MKKNLVIAMLLPLLAACQAIRQPASRAQLDASAPKMTPYFQCIHYFHGNGEAARSAAAIDRAVSIGEQDGLATSDIMSIYASIRTAQKDKINAYAQDLAARRGSTLKRFDGTAVVPTPTSEEEMQALLHLFAEACDPLDVS